MMQGGTLVCIVDDDLSVRRSLARLIGACGMATRSFSSADEYLDAYAGLDVGCLVLDIHLGAVSGLDLLGELRSRGVQTPVVVITAFDEPSLEKRARREGAIDYLRKPFDDAAIIGAIERAIRHDNGSMA